MHHHVPDCATILDYRHSQNSGEVECAECAADRFALSILVRDYDVQFPDPCGTTAHAIGATIAAIILGPEPATIVVSIALLIQALFFGDGGITAYGANCFNMAITVPYIAYAIYSAFSKNQPLTSKRRLVGAFVGGWTGVTVAAFFAGVEFEIQPLLFKTANGTPLYAPYPLSVTIPAMIIPHAFIASVAEGILAALVVAYLQRSNISVLEAAEKPAVLGEASGLQKLRALWIVLVVLIIASPLGLLAPGTAFGEWGTDELASRGLGYIRLDCKSYPVCGALHLRTITCLRLVM